MSFHPADESDRGGTRYGTGKETIRERVLVPTERAQAATLSGIAFLSFRAVRLEEEKPGHK
jgi:hypothetical protein